MRAEILVIGLEATQGSSEQTTGLSLSNSCQVQVIIWVVEPLCVSLGSIIVMVSLPREKESRISALELQWDPEFSFMLGSHLESS